MAWCEDAIKLVLWGYSRRSWTCSSRTENNCAEVIDIIALHCHVLWNLWIFLLFWSSITFDSDMLFLIIFVACLWIVLRKSVYLAGSQGKTQCKPESSRSLSLSLTLSLCVSVEWVILLYAVVCLVIASVQTLFFCESEIKQTDTTWRVVLLSQVYFIWDFSSFK